MALVSFQGIPWGLALGLFVLFLVIYHVGVELTERRKEKERQEELKKFREELLEELDKGYVKKESRSKLRL